MGVSVSAVSKVKNNKKCLIFSTFLSLLKISRDVPTRLVIRDREHATSMAALASFSAMAASTLHLQAEDALYTLCQDNSVSQAEVEVGVRDRSRALVMTVDHNNFLPCCTVSESVSGCSRIDYRPI